MTGTFAVFQSGLSALRYNRAAMDVASSNIANASTTGYTRRQVIAQTTGAPAQQALWSTWDGTGGGVEATGVRRLVDGVLDARARTEHATGSFLDARSASLGRLETAIAEPGDHGIASALDAFKTSWHALANNPADPAARAAVLAKAQSLRDTVATQASGVANEWATQRVSLDSGVAEVNQVASQLADLNRALLSAYVGDTDANNLLDQRDQLTQRLAELTGATTAVNADTTVTVSVAGQDLVNGVTAATLSVTGSADLAGADSDPVQLSIDGTPVTLTTGELGAHQQMIATDLPNYLASLDAFVASMAGAVNGQQSAGNDLDGVTGTDLFAGTTARTLTVALTDPRKLAAADPSKGLNDNTNATAMAGLDMGSASYRSLITTFGTQVNAAQQGANNQAALVDQIEASRESISGVNQDEEMVSLLTAQRGYQAASRVLTTMDDMLDTLINRTGLVGR